MLLHCSIWKGMLCTRHAVLQLVQTLDQACTCTAAPVSGWFDRHALALCMIQVLLVICTATAALAAIGASAVVWNSWLLMHLLPGVHCEDSWSLWRAGSLRGLVRQLSIDQFENEGRRVSMGTDSVGKQSHASGRTPMFDRAMSEPGVHKVGRRALWEVCCC